MFRSVSILSLRFLKFQVRVLDPARRSVLSLADAVRRDLPRSRWRHRGGAERKLRNKEGCLPLLLCELAARADVSKAAETASAAVVLWREKVCTYRSGRKEGASERREGEQWSVALAVVLESTTPTPYVPARRLGRSAVCVSFQRASSLTGERSTNEQQTTCSHSTLLI